MTRLIECIWCGQQMRSPCTYYEQTDNCLAYKWANEDMANAKLDATLARVDAALNEEDEQ